jgi:hypothetical protein
MNGQNFIQIAAYSSASVILQRYIGNPHPMSGTFMRKALLPMLAALALCGTATFALIAGNAHAQPEHKKPMMIALVTPGTKAESTVSAAGRGGAGAAEHRLHLPAPAEIATHFQQICQDRYARQAGLLAYAEAKLSLTSAQQPLFAHWKQVKLDIAKRRADACAARARPANAKMPTLIDRMAQREDMLRQQLADLDAERPALDALFKSLSPEQKQELGRGLAALRGPMRAHGMFAGGPAMAGHGMMRQGMMRPGLMRRAMMRRGAMGAPPPGAAGEAPPAPPPQ